ncbi:hypothetical protein PGH07_04970 [Sulfurovum sp. zt1-1]|uniref:Uncharacterized protein n=1 Tax=Sulfurovum zhangzhouensis TaxID=3019067 RepID=A0ABT7QXF7_9BACT|nr:hypothetical protein [Sulfurovum zhangzhouensis]MDM5271517.1 hypothetical protein [Sulfurovum zhangzhouensis]
MFRIVIIPLIFSTFLISSPMFTVRLGVFDINNEIHILNTIDRFSPALKKTVNTYKTDRFIYVHTIPTDKKKHLTKLLPAYRKIFPDAYIGKIK